MSEMKIDEAKKLNFVLGNKEDIAKDDHFVDELQILDVENDKVIYVPQCQQPDNGNGENTLSSHQDEQEIIKKKYGGLLTKKHPLISKDHERAFFDSADWALNKQESQKSKGPFEALRPKLEPSPHQLIRSRSTYANPHETEDDEINAAIRSEEITSGDRI